MSYGGFVEKTEEREQLGDLELERKPILESYSKLIIEGRIHLFQGTCLWLAFVDTVMNSRGNIIWPVEWLSDYQAWLYSMEFSFSLVSIWIVFCSGLCWNCYEISIDPVVKTQSVCLSGTAGDDSDSAYLSCCGRSPSSGSPPARRTYYGCRRIWVLVGRAERSARRPHSWKTCRRPASRSAGSSRSHGDSPR